MWDLCAVFDADSIYAGCLTPYGRGGSFLNPKIKHPGATFRTPSSVLLSVPAYRVTELSIQFHAR